MTNLNSINLHAMVVPSTENQLLTWVEFRTDLRDRKDRGFKFPTVDRVCDAYKDICEEICDDLAEQGLLLSSSTSTPLLYEICLKNGAKIFLGKFWPEDVTNNYVRMWPEETWRNSENVVSVIEKSAVHNKSL